jgi:glycosyltransferase involved in cell wall biosynthesis
MSKTFVTIFPNARDFHIHKDVGMIPFVMARDFGYQSTLVCFANSPNYPTLQSESTRLNIDFLHGRLFGKRFVVLSVLWYLLRNARKTDVLHLFFQSRATFFAGILYRLLNRKGRLYVRLDVDASSLAVFRPGWVHTGCWNFFFRRVVSLVSCESTAALRILEQRYKGIAGSLMLLPGGVDDVSVRECGIRLCSFSEKENIILTVSRIGAVEKNADLLLSALEKVLLRDWRAVFIGPLEPDYRKVIADFYRRNPHLSDRVIFTGAVGRAVLFEWYNKAKVFCLTSHYESFGIVFAEAMYFGNYIVSTPVSAAEDITGNETMGAVVTNSKELAQTLQALIDDQQKIEQLMPAIRQWAKQHYTWRRIVSLLHERLKDAASAT